MRASTFVALVLALLVTACAAPGEPRSLVPVAPADAR